MSSVLVTQCLQNDFVSPLGRYDSLPNLLHIGWEESRRLLGERPGEGPVARLMAWAYEQPDDKLRLIHIRDWHDPRSAEQKTHLAFFHDHCLQGTPGADFVFATPAASGKAVAVIDSPTLNDFLSTPLQPLLSAITPAPARFGLVGVWTEAKITFLAYELRSRYPDADIAVCSALTASSSRAKHFQALEHLARLLGVRVIDSVGDFIDFLGGDTVDSPTLPVERDIAISLPADYVLRSADRALLGFLFRDCRQLACRVLDGGFSGNVVLFVDSVDCENRQQAPHVVKMGDSGPIARERAAFERVEAVLGNAAPAVDDHADHDGRGAIKYRYASMGGGSAATLQKLFQQGIDETELGRLLDTVFVEQLGRLYNSAEREKVDLLAYYEFESRWAPSVRKRVEALLAKPAVGNTLEIIPGLVAPNLCHFYEHSLDKLSHPAGRSWWFGWVHGDLNGANILRDGQGNVWLIDFFHTHRGHILRDLAKLENDLLYIWTPVANAAELEEAARLSDALLAIEDLATPLPSATQAGLTHATFVRSWNAIGKLRSYYPALIRSDRDPLQLQIAQLRYAAHTLGFEESTAWQKRWALYTASHAAARIEKRLSADDRLRIDWLAADAPHIGITLLPGRLDYGRDLGEDIAALKAAGATHVLSLLTSAELENYGVPDLAQRMGAAGLKHCLIPLIDQLAATSSQLKNCLSFMDAATAVDGRIVLHCVGGLGRSGMIAAAWLIKRQGLTAQAAIARVRSNRSARAIETAAQEAWVKRLRPVNAEIA